MAPDDFWQSRYDAIRRAGERTDACRAPIPCATLRLRLRHSGARSPRSGRREPGRRLRPQNPEHRRVYGAPSVFMDSGLPRFARARNDKSEFEFRERADNVGRWCGDISMTEQRSGLPVLAFKHSAALETWFSSQP